MFGVTKVSVTKTNEGKASDLHRLLQCLVTVDHILRISIIMSFTPLISRQ